MFDGYEGCRLPLSTLICASLLHRIHGQNELHGEDYQHFGEHLLLRMDGQARAIKGGLCIKAETTDSVSTKLIHLHHISNFFPCISHLVLQKQYHHVIQILLHLPLCFAVQSVTQLCVS